MSDQDPITPFLVKLHNAAPSSVEASSAFRTAVRLTLCDCSLLLERIVTKDAPALRAKHGCAKEQAPAASWVESCPDGEARETKVGDFTLRVDRRSSSAELEELREANERLKRAVAEHSAKTLEWRQTVDGLRVQARRDRSVISEALAVARVPHAGDVYQSAAPYIREAAALQAENERLKREAVERAEKVRERQLTVDRALQENCSILSRALTDAQYPHGADVYTAAADYIRKGTEMRKRLRQEIER